MEGFSEATAAAAERHQSMLGQLQAKWAARQLAVPTSDRLVQLRLRELGEPIALFGERPEDRRDRLRETLARAGSDVALPRCELARRAALSAAAAAERSGGSAEEGGFTDSGDARLRAARMWLVHYSLPRARARVESQQQQQQQQKQLSDAACARARRFTSALSGVGDDRPLSACALAADGALALTGAWSGLARLWRTADCECVRTFRGHTDRVLGVAFRPGFAASEEQQRQSATLCAAATASADGSVMLWAAGSESPLATLRRQSPAGGVTRANRVAFHPSGRLLAATGDDNCWRLWELETNTCLLEQHGHTHGSVFGAAFQCDGSLLATCGADAHVRVWDLRAGTCVQVFEGHVEAAVSADWSPNGFLLASGSADNSVRLWDLRMRKCASVVPAHASLVSALRFDSGGNVLASASFDGTAKLWSVGPAGAHCTPLATLCGHEAKLVGIDMSAGPEPLLITASFDRTWKLWTCS